MNHTSKDNFASIALIVAAFVSIAAGTFSNDASATSPVVQAAKPVHLQPIVVTAKRVK